MLRGRVRVALALCLALGLVALAALADMLLVRLGEAAAGQIGDPTASLGAQLANLRVQVRAAEAVLWLGTASVGALAVALAWLAMHLLVLRRVEAAARTAAAQGDDMPAVQGDELDKLSALLQAYRRQLADERAERSAQLEALGSMRDAADAIAEKLQQADRLALVGRVAMGMAHEIGGPLAIVVGYLERLHALEVAGAPADQRLRCVDQAQHAADRIHALLSDMAQPGLPQQRDVDRPCDLGAVTLRVAAQAEQHPRAKTLDIALDVSQPQHPADASASHMEQVLLNLVVNAADALKSGGQVRIGVRRDGDWQEATVDDNGPGIAAENRERVFDEFYSTKGGGEGQATKRSGWGLGLAVSRRIVGRYGGTLVAGDSPLGGARMTLRVPVPANLRKAARISGSEKI